MIEYLSSPTTALVLAYLVGSIPAGLILTRLVGLGDLRSYGSGNIGATNALRAGGKKLGLATLVLDIIKGTAGVWLIYHLTHSIQWAHYGLLAVMVGHCFPIWLSFKGGKGVATTIGALIAFYHIIQPVPVHHIILPLAAIWLAIFFTTRYVSLASIIGAVAVPMVSAYWFDWSIENLVLAVLIIGKHHSNIRNLLAGQEYRFSLNRSSKEAS